MVALGERLRQQRLSRGVDIATISESTRISVRYLTALENGDSSQLPGAVFARSFARQYAQSIGLDPSRLDAEIQAAFPQELSVPEPPPTAPSTWTFRAPEIDIQGAIRSLEGLSASLPQSMIGLAATLAVCSLAYVGWQKLVLPEGNNQIVVSNPAAGVPPTKLPAGATVQPQVRTSSASGSPVEAQNVSSEAAPLAGPDAPTTIVAGSAIELEIPPASGAQRMMVRLVASQETWISITANGKRVYAGTLYPNEVRALNGVEKAQMVVGNAAGLQVIADGRSLGPIGPAGQVRVVSLSPDGSQITRAVAPKPAEPAADSSEEDSTKTRT